MSDKILAAISLNTDSCDTLLAQLRSQHTAIFTTLDTPTDSTKQRNELSNLLLTAELLTEQLREQLDGITALLLRGKR
jgi:hypothetical protein